MPTHTVSAGLWPIDQIVINERIFASTPEHEHYIEHELVPSIQALGLIHPIALNKKANGTMELIDGFSRLTAFKLLGYTEIPYCLHADLPLHELHVLEMESNMRRRGIDWQDKVLGLQKIHQMRELAALKKLAEPDYERWTQQSTGDLLGVSKGHVSQCLSIAKALEAADEEIWNAPTFDAARKILLQRQRQKVEAELARRQQESFIVVANEVSDKQPMPVLDLGLLPSGGANLSQAELLSLGGTPTTQAKPKQMLVDLSSRLINGECVSLKQPGTGFMETAPAESFDLIFTDIPYGIPIENMDLADKESVEDAHDVEENAEQMPIFLREAYRILRDRSYLVFFYALDYHERLLAWGRQVGFSAQVKPLIWHKTSQVRNQAGNKWWTGNYEVCMVMAKGTATLEQARQNSIIAASSLDARRKYGHAFAKPEMLSREILSAFARPGMIGLDPYAGTGSMAVAATQLGVKMTCVEKETHHFNQLLVHMQDAYRNLFPDKTVIFR